MLHPFAVWTADVPVITLPDSYTEIQVVFGTPNGNIVSAQYTKDIIDSQLTQANFTKYFLSYVSKNLGYYISFSIGAGTINILEFQYSGTSVLESASHNKAIGVFYR